MLIPPTQRLLRRIGRPLMVVALVLGSGYALVGSVLQTEPLVAMTAAIETADVAHALVLVRSHDPRRVPAGQLNAVVLNERDLDVLINHVAHRRQGYTCHIARAVRDLGVDKIEQHIEIVRGCFLRGKCSR